MSAEWQVSQGAATGDWYVRPSDDHRLTIAWFENTDTGRERAHLLAASPDLLAAAEALLECLDTVFLGTPDWEDRPEPEALRRAINKARGNQ